MRAVDLNEVVGGLDDDELFDPAVWEAIQAESEQEIEYTTPIKKRLRARALEREEELRLQQFYEMDERDYFWRASPRQPVAQTVQNPASIMAPKR